MAAASCSPEARHFFHEAQFLMVFACALGWNLKLATTQRTTQC
jgi:hypothetical protein